MTPPKPVARQGKTSLLKYLRLFRRDLLSAQPEHLFTAKMAEFRTPFFRSFLINQPDLIRQVLNERPLDFPKSDRVTEGLVPLLGRKSVFVTNGEEWLHQRRLIEPAFEGGRLRDTFPAMLVAAQEAVERLKGRQAFEAEEYFSHFTADVIFRTLFSVPISHQLAATAFNEFQSYQKSQPILNLAAFLPLPRWMPRFHRPGTRRSAKRLRKAISALTEARAVELRAGIAPDDLASKIMRQTDPVDGSKFSAEEMIDQVAIFFLAGHETSAAALAWALYLLASDETVQNEALEEAKGLPDNPTFSDVNGLRFIRDIVRETLRLYPPVPMMVRSTTRPERFRNRDLPKGTQIVISPWHLHRNDRFWSRPDAFEPARFSAKESREAVREAYLPFSSGARICPGAGFALTEAVLILALLIRRFRFFPVDSSLPVPVAHLTLRSKSGVHLGAEVREL